MMFIRQHCYIYKGVKGIRVITIALQKGGSGKTTTAQALGQGLARKGHKVLFIDLDTQGNLTSTLDAKQSNKSAYEVIKGSVNVSESIQHTERGDIIPSSPRLAQLDTEITGAGREYHLREGLKGLRGYDFVIIDTPPASGLIVDNALTASDGVIIPAQPDIFSYQGLEQFGRTIGSVQRYTNPGLRILGILITRYNARATLNREIVKTMQLKAESLGTIVYPTKIRECVTIKEVQATKETVYDYPRNNAAKDYMAFVEAVIKQIGE